MHRLLLQGQHRPHTSTTSATLPSSTQERTLTHHDIAHDQRIVVAIKETIRLMGKIDDVIDAHGGWPIQ